MRLFLAIDLPKEIKEYLFQLEKKFKEAKITWVSKKNLHLTLKFLGEVEEKDLSKIKSQIKIEAKTLSLHVAKLGFFPHAESPTVIWISLEPEEQVIELQQKIDGHLLTSFPGEQKFQAHITLGRIKSIRRKKDFFNSVESIIIEPRSFKVDSFQLMSSTLTKNGSLYKTLENVNLS
ncbi:RNA 2',3'-cyclic phosphodiesterase [Candidatus Woesearchaeota archaeon]|nr:RNA 2',3'-cyclic phosphodiesterase [Candidatus Woesearchaeota archaeon]